MATRHQRAAAAPQPANRGERRWLCSVFLIWVLWGDLPELGVLWGSKLRIFLFDVPNLYDSSGKF